MALIVVVSALFLVSFSPVIGIAGLLLAALVAWPQTQRWVDRRSIDRVFEANPFLAAPLEATFTDDGVSVRRGAAGDSHSDYGWSAFVLWIESPDLFVLCQSTAKRGGFLPVAKRGAIDRADVDRVRAALAAYVPRPE